MITLAIFEQMARDEVAGLTANQDFFWEEVPLQSNGAPANGVWLITRGGSSENTPKGLNLRTTVDFYVAFPNKVKTEQVHRAISDYIRTNPCFCELSGVVSEYSYDYHNVRWKPATTPENAGATGNGNIVKMASAEIVYDLHQI
jgi:hypothetical protein